MKEKTVLMIMVDAFRHDYINRQDSPFLHSLALKGATGSLAPSFGFEPDGAYFAGLDPEECDGGAQYWRNPHERVFYFQNLFRFLDILPFEPWHRFIRKVIRFSAQVMATDSMTRKMAPPNQIPLSILHEFSFPMRKLAHEPGFTTSPTLFDAARSNNLDYLFHGHPAFKVKTPAVVDRYLHEDRGQYDFTFLFMGDLDGIGHKYGPCSEQRRDMLGKIDTAISSIHSHAEKNYNDVDIVIFGDHGMVEVNGLVDLTEVTQSCFYDNEVVSYFIDSTFARFWLKSGKSGNRLRSRLGALGHGHILGVEETEACRIRYPHNYFGDLIFAVDDGKLIHPSFYATGGTPPRGMHGYLPGCRDNESAFVLSSKRCSSTGDLGRIDMRRMYPTVLDMLGILQNTSIPHKLESIL